MRFIVLIFLVSLILVMVLLFLVTLLVHVQGIAYKSEDVEAPGLIHPVNILRLSVAVAVLVVMLVLVAVVSRFGLQ